MPSPQEGKEYLLEIDNDTYFSEYAVHALNTLIRDYNERKGCDTRFDNDPAAAKAIDDFRKPLPQPNEQKEVETISRDWLEEHYGASAASCQESEHDNEVCALQTHRQEYVSESDGRTYGYAVGCGCKCHEAEKAGESWQKGYEAGKREERERIVRVVFGYPPLDEKLTLDLIREIQDSVDD